MNRKPRGVNKIFVQMGDFMNKKIKMFFIFLLIFCILIFFIQKTYKTVRTGNNISKSTDDLVEYILNISSYEATLEVTIHSNKTVNKYVIEQYFLQPSYAKQIVKEPENIENLEILYNGKNLEIRNSNLGLSKIYENYKYLNENILWLNFFIENYKNEYNIEENNEEIILTSNISKYNYNEKLYISKKSSLPTKIEIIDNSNNNKIYIEYKEIKLNNIRENNIFAFTTKDIRKEV